MPLRRHLSPSCCCWALLLMFTAAGAPALALEVVADDAPVPTVEFNSEPLLIRSAHVVRLEGSVLLGGDRLRGTTAAEKANAIGAALSGAAAAGYFGDTWRIPSGGEILHVRDEGCFNFWDVDSHRLDDTRDTIVLTFALKTDAERSVVLALGCSGGFAVLVNDRIAHVRLPNGVFSDASDLVTLPLRAGLNRVRIVARTSDRRSTKLYAPEWVAKIRVFADAASAIAVHVRHNVHPFVRPLVASPDKIRAINGAPFFRTAVAYDGDTRLGEGTVDAGGNITWTTLREALPRVILVSLDGKSSEPVVLCEDAEVSALQPAQFIPFDAAQDKSPWPWRFVHLLKPDNIRLDELQWLQKFALSSYGLRCPEKIPAFPGSLSSALGIGTYTSGLDGGSQYFEYFVPRRALNSDQPIPLLVILPTAADPVRPFLESYYLGGLKEMESWAAVADEYGYALLWPGYADVDCGGPLAQRCLAESLQAYERSIPVKISGRYLMGICSSGVAATRALFEANYTISGICLYSPLVVRQKHRLVQGMPPFMSVATTDALPDVSIDEIGRRLSLVPCAMLYDSGMPGHGDRAHTFALRDACAKFGRPMTQLSAPMVAEYTWGERMKYRLRLFSEWLVKTETAGGTPYLAGAKPRPARSVRDWLLEGFTLPSVEMGLANWSEVWNSTYRQWRGASLPAGRPDRATVLETRAVETPQELGDAIAVKLASAGLDPASTQLFGVFASQEKATASNGHVVVFRSRSAQAPFPAVDPLLDGNFSGAIWRREHGAWVQRSIW